MNAITGFITNTIMGALKGAFDSAGQWLGGLGTQMAGIFGGGGGSAAIPGALPSWTPGMPGGVPGAPGGAAGAVGAGLSGTIGMVTGIASAASSIFGNFQMAAMNSTLKMIEENTRFSYLHTSNLLQPIYDLTSDFRARWAGGLGIFNQEGDTGVRLAPYEFNGGLWPVAAGGGGGNVTVNVDTLIGTRDFIDEIAVAVAEKLKDQGTP
jgi:hypothetical protein